VREHDAVGELAPLSLAQSVAAGGFGYLRGSSLLQIGYQRGTAATDLGFLAHKHPDPHDSIASSAAMIWATSVRRV
jgi:hypothetical protein